jgi:hypothetical protein
VPTRATRAGEEVEEEDVEIAAIAADHFGKIL